MTHEPISTPSISQIQAQKAQQTAGFVLAQEASSEETADWAEPGFNPVTMARRFESLEAKVKKKEEESKKAEKKEQKIISIQRLEEVSEQYQRKNPELQARTLLLLRSRLKKTDTAEEIIAKVLEAYTDPSLADEALDYLIDTAEEEFASRLKEAKEELNKRHEREIKAGRNMGSEARAFASTGLGSPTALRDMYRDITGNPREATQLFDELSNNFTYDKMNTVIDFLMHALGSDLKSKGPSIARAELHRLMTESRTLGAILGAYNYFNARMRLISSSFKRSGLSLPAALTFEALAKLFIKFLQERYPSVDKILQYAALLGIREEVLAQIIVYTQMRDAVRQTAPRLYRSDQHRQDVLTSFMDTLEELDEELEEEEEEEEGEKKDG